MFLVSVLPSGWAAYPGTNIPNGVFQGPLVMDGDACLRACASLAICFGFDFNANNGGCWLHNAARKCNTLNSAPVVYHAIKLPICSKSTSLSCGTYVITQFWHHWGKMTAIFQTIFFSAFNEWKCMKMHWYLFPLSLILRVQLTTFQHLFR